MAAPQKTNPSTETPASVTPATPKKRKRRKRPQSDGTRETVESIAIAFVLAFLFKTFQAEAYVIPTGSMAPTLYGRHKEVTCEGCGFHFTLGASSELDQQSGYLTGRIDRVYCSNCGKEQSARNAPVFNGDRIVVNKQVSEFRRFDVVVFKNPEQGHVNYIKRLVGLPGETLRVRKGDLWRQTESRQWEILRKDDPAVQKDIQLTVYDDRFVPDRLMELGWPERWVPARSGAGPDSVGGWVESANGWTPNREARTYTFDGNGQEQQWLRYRHFLPEKSVWPDDVQEASELLSAQASLIADFCSFNAYNHHDVPALGEFDYGVYWVGDLTLNATVDVAKNTGFVTLELVEGDRTYRCRFDLSSGAVELTSNPTGSSTERTHIATGLSEMASPGEYRVVFANVDDRLCVWVDNELVTFDAPTEYVGSDIPQPGRSDLCPCGIGASDAKLTVSELLLERDIYYRNDIQDIDQDNVAYTWRVRDSKTEVRSVTSLHTLLRDPDAWAGRYLEESSEQLEKYGQYGIYELADDEYLMFGDNSSMSQDGRLFYFDARPENGVFSHRYAVRERDLIGKALFIFWPHGVPFLNDGEGIPVWNHKSPHDNVEAHTNASEYPRFRVPYYPNIHRMKKIR